jgi:hypothetical protein
MPFLPFLAIFGMIAQCCPKLAIDNYPHDSFWAISCPHRTRFLYCRAYSDGRTARFKYLKIAG